MGSPESEAVKEKDVEPAGRRWYGSTDWHNKKIFRLADEGMGVGIAGCGAWSRARN
jgi:hypothetical protein